MGVPTYKENKIRLHGIWVAGFQYNGYTGNHIDPTPFYRIGGAVVPGLSHEGVLYAADSLNSAISFVPEVFPTARNKAWQDLVSQVREDPSTMGATLAEGRQSLGMIAERCGQMYRAYSHLRKGDFRPFLRELTIAPKRRHRNTIKTRAEDAANLWLEYSFGWSPLCKDIYNGLTVLEKPVPGGAFSGSGREDVNLVYGSYSPGSWYRYQYDGIGVCKQGARVYVVNPNLFLLQSTGLANPALVAWEVVPFSFMVDWCADVSTAIGSITDLMGCEVIGGYTTYFSKVHCEIANYVGGTLWDLRPQQGPLHRVWRQTSLSHPLPNFNFQQNIGGSLKRAANAASLLVQILSH